jgi:23S rRNA (adenine-N6)-dimethyltransferase
MPTYRGGRHEHGQNFLTDQRTIQAIIDLVARTDGPIIEIGPGGGALTLDLQDLGRPLTAVEIDARTVHRLAPRLHPAVELIHADFLHWRLPSAPHVVVGNLPFHQTTAMLRRVLHAPGWTDAILLVQWEVARRRAGVGGATMMTAQWWPWVEFDLVGRVRAGAFTPAPSVDGGLLAMTRRPQELVPARDRRAYRGVVHAVFTGRGRGIAEILGRLVAPRHRRQIRERLGREGIAVSALPKELTAEQWARLFSAFQEWGRGSVRRDRGTRRG